MTAASALCAAVAGSGSDAGGTVFTGEAAARPAPSSAARGGCRVVADRPAKFDGEISRWFSMVRFANLKVTRD